MKKLIYCALALATGLFASSCQQENLEPVQQGNTVTFNVQLPDVATKASDAVAVDKLDYAVYRVVDSNISEAEAKSMLTAENVADKKYHLVYQERVDIANRDAISVNLELMNDQRYVVLFWAQNGNTWFAEGEEFINIDYPANDDITGNEVNREAFTGSAYIKVDGSVNENIVLTRPFAQLNIATNLPDPVRFNNFKVENTVVKVTGVATSFNVATQAANIPTNDYEAIYAAEPFVTTSGDYQAFGAYACYLSMNYMFVPTDLTNVTVVYDIKTKDYGTVNNTITNVPIKKNYKTNIVGNLLTSGVEYNVTLENWATNSNSGTTEVLADGVVINQNGDYEIINANGLAYAINKLFAEGGNFYLTKDVYDISGFEVTPPTIPAGKTLNIYGETPVVTRAASTLTGITIIGLPKVEGTPTLIAEVVEGGSVSVSGVTLNDEGSVLVENNLGTLVVSESSADTYVAEGNDPVDAKEVKDFASLKAAIASGVKVIEIADNITANKVVFINRAVTINGNNKTFTTTDTRAFRLIASDIEVTFNDLNIVSSAVRVGSTDIRGVSIDGGTLENVSLTLNNCSHDFTDASAHDWTYAVNVVGGTGYKVTIVGGEYEGANVVNVWGTNHTFVIDGAVLTSLYQPSSAYYGFCVSLQDAENSIATIKNSTLNSVHAKAFGGTTKNEFVLENNEDNTQVYPFFIGNAPYLTLNEAFAAAENNTTIYAPFNAEISSSTVPAGKKVTLVLQNQTTKYNTQLTGTDESTGSFGLINVNPGADLTISGPGSIKLSATNDREWNAYSSVVSNQRGTLTVNEGATIEHLGGTAMAYGIDNLTNGKGTSAITTINKATIKSPYRAIRQFLNGVEATNELYVNAEAVIEGGNKSIWMQDPSTNANTGKLVVAEGAELYGDVYLFVTAGSTEWPVSVSITASTLKDGSEVMTGNVPEGYSVEEKNGVYEVTYKSPAQARLEALINEGGEVVLTENVELSSPIVIENVTVTLDLNGKTITAGKDGYAIENKGELTIKNNGVINGVVYAEGPAAKTIIDGGTYNALENAKYVLLNSQGASLTINAATINGGSSYPIYSYDASSKLVINDATVNATFGCVNSYGTNGSVEINGGTFNMTGVQGKTSHIAYFSNVDAVINGGTFNKIGDINMSSAGGGGICAIYGANLTIKGGSFAGDYADVYDWGGKNANDRAVAISVEGGTYKFKPTFLAGGFAATQNADGTWTVAKN